MRINIVVARNDRDLVGRTDAVEPRERRLVFRRQTEVHQVAGDGDMVRSELLSVGNQPVGHRCEMDVPSLALPIEIAEQPLGIPVPPVETRNGREVHIGEVRERKNFCHLEKQGWRGEHNLAQYAS